MLPLFNFFEVSFIVMLSFLCLQNSVIDVISIQDGDREVQPPRNLKLEILEGKY